MKRRRAEASAEAWSSHPEVLSKKMMNSRRICPADGSQYKDSAVGLVFMESAAGLAMELSATKAKEMKRRRAEASADGLALMTSCHHAVGYQQMNKSERDEATSC
ncbi:hypothetical protein F511_40421 [Dorcoceras hygrometricum]|uniref:Uncharacterized protein n=1 Tax=Dorcoceras hygrometricum TaxID=472368 RepID=A0A2Z7D5T6_9LAMI|nr:hypothetical protein F511_40421 [Dorcoceras hygrometricum]